MNGPLPLETCVIETWFIQLHTLPLAYLVVLVWVVAATVCARLLGPMVVSHTTGWLYELLNRRVPVSTTGDHVVEHLFEQSILYSINVRLVYLLRHDLSRLFCVGVGTVRRTTYQLPEKILVPEKYWSGCPPN